MRTIDLVRAINDALALQQVLMPILQDALNAGETEVSDEEVALAKASLLTGIARVDAKIEKL